MNTWRAVRAPVLLGLATLAAVVGTVLVTSAGTDRLLDPTSTGPAGARALAGVLRAQGITVERVGNVGAIAGRAGAGATVFVPVPQQLPAGALRALARLPGRPALVVVGPDTAELTALGLPVRAEGVTPVRSRHPGCDLPAAVTAGTAETGGITYAAAVPADTCYSGGGRPSLLVVPGPPRVTIVGTPTPFTNDRIGYDGNAALALGLLGTRPRLLWLAPAPPTAATGGGQTALVDLLPTGALAAAGQLVVAGVLLVAWRGRRLGPVVGESLPVVVRAGETVIGRARLTAAAGARNVAAGDLRGAARRRLAHRVGVPPDASRETLIDAVARRTGRSPASLGELLYGAPAGTDISDDRALVRLADALDREVQRT